MFVGSYYVNVTGTSAHPEVSLPQNVITGDLVNTRNALGKYFSFLYIFFDFQFLSVPKKRRLDEDFERIIKEPEFGDLKDKPLGSVLSILFWNDQQSYVYKRVTSMKHTLLVGDYGTGLCFIIFRYY